MVEYISHQHSQPPPDGVWTMNYEWVEFIGTLALPWGVQGDEWVRRVQENIKQMEGVDGTGIKNDLTTQPFIELRMTCSGSEVDTRLLVLPLQDGQGIQIGFGGRTGKIDEPVAEMWASAISKASDELGSKEKHGWTALIGQYPEKVGTYTIRLADNGEVGGMSLTSTGSLIREPVQSMTPSFSTWGVRASVPILVRGASQGHDWDQAQTVAADTLNRLVGLLSLAWDRRIEVRESAAPLAWGERRAPERIPYLSDDFGLELDDKPAATDVSLPDWLDDAWKKLEKQRKLGAALSTYMEGVRIAEDHPSLALVAFISTIESISLMLFKKQKCPNCHNHMNVSAKFRETLRLAIGDHEAASLAATYSKRSKTVHESRLHGNELLPGATQFSIFSMPAERDFHFQSVYRIKVAAQKLLLMALRNELPPRREFTGEGADG
ncbi:hypothetical protein AB0C21_33090 [Spirillospora sp. NPDC049024]